MFILNLFTFNSDAPRPWGMYFQHTAIPQTEALVELHDNVMFYLVIILFGTAWIFITITKNYIGNKISNKHIKDGEHIVPVLTIILALMLILMGFHSFKLLYLMDEVTDSSLTVFVEGHQWYWSYQYPDFPSDDNEELELEFDSYLVPESDLEKVTLRMDNILNPTVDCPKAPAIPDNRLIVNLEYKSISNNAHFLHDTQDPSGRHVQTLRWNSHTGTISSQVINGVPHNGLLMSSSGLNSLGDGSTIRVFRIHEAELDRISGFRRVTSAFSDLVVDNKYAQVHERRG